MKHILLALLLLSLLPSAFAELPEEVIVGTDTVPASKFTAWKAADPSAYSGTYSGDTGGDTGANLKIKLTKTQGPEADLHEFSGAGTFLQQTAGYKPTSLTFANAPLDTEELITVTASSFQIIFVSYGKQKGVVIDGYFIPRE